MKNTNVNLNRIFSVVALMAVLFLAAVPAMANKDKETRKSKSPIEVKYVGSNQQSPVLEISMDNESGEETIISIKDLDGNVLYKESFTDRKIVKKVQFDNFTIDPIQIKLTATVKGKTHTEVFEINRNRVVVEEVKISKL